MARRLACRRRHLHRATRPARHTSNAPASRTNLRHRADPSSRAAPGDSLRCSPIHHPVVTPQRRQRAMNPEAIAARLIAAHHPRRRRQPEPAPRPASAPAPPPQITGRTVFTHGSTPKPGRHRQLPLLLTQLKCHEQRRLAYTHAPGGSLRSSQPPLVSDTLGELNRAARS